MAKTPHLEQTFDTVSSAYDKMRPGYVKEIYDAIFSYISLDKSSHIVEVGSGSGQATRPFLDIGCQLTAVEYGKNLAELLAENFKSFPNIKVINSRFEDAVFGKDSCDLVFSATAFHWINEETGYKKVFSMLRDGGAFARFANHPSISKNAPALAEDIEKIYDEYYYSYYKDKQRSACIYSEGMAKDTAMIAEKYGFADIQYHIFHRKRIFSADEYVKLLGTYSDHIAIEKSIRDEFFANIKAAIIKHGGTLTIDDALDLQLARKPYQTI